MYVGKILLYYGNITFLFLFKKKSDRLPQLPSEYKNVLLRQGVHTTPLR